MTTTATPQAHQQGATPARVATDLSFIRFIYPFQFKPTDFVDRVEQIHHATLQIGGARKRVGVWEPWKDDIFPSDFLLAHVGNQLKPGSHVAMGFWKLREEVRLDEHGLGSHGTWRFKMARLKQQPDVTFRVDEVHLILFPVGIGFVVSHVVLDTDDLDMWYNFLHYFRFVDGQRATSLHALWGVDQHPFYPFDMPLKGPTGQAIPLTFGHIIEALLRTSDIGPKTGADPWWRGVAIPGQVLPFVCLFVDNIGGDTHAKATCVHRVRRFFHAAESLHLPDEDVRLIDHPNLLVHSKDMWFTISLEGGAFVACDAPEESYYRGEFNPNVPDKGGTITWRLKRIYYFLFVLALHQKLAVEAISNEVATAWLPTKSGGSGDQEPTMLIETRERQLENIHDRLIRFMALSYFTQVAQQEKHHQYYARLQAAFTIEQLYKEVTAEVREMHDYLYTLRQDRADSLAANINKIVFALGLPLFVLSLISTLGTLGLLGKAQDVSFAFVLLPTGTALVCGYLLIEHVPRIREWNKAGRLERMFRFVAPFVAILLLTLMLLQTRLGYPWRVADVVVGVVATCAVAWYRYRSRHHAAS